MNGITDLFHSENEYYDNQRVTGLVHGLGKREEPV